MGAVLCGGASRRMGRDKAFVAYDGVAMVERVAATLRAAGCTQVVAVGGDTAALAAAGLACVPDEFPGEGPLGGVITALDHFAGRGAADSDTVVVVACDLPRLTAITVAAVVAALAAAPAGTGVAMARTDRPEPLCAAWRAAARPGLAAAFDRGERRLGVAAQEVGALETAVAAMDLVNVNTPGDLSQ